MENIQIIIFIALLVITFITIFLLIKSSSKNKYYEEKYSKIINIDQEFKKLNNDKGEIEKTILELRTSYREKKKIFDKLVEQAAIYNEEIELAELGFYKPHFDFDTSEKYKEQIELIKSKQKKMVLEKTAVYCTTEWSVEGSKAKGRTMTNRSIRLTARAFNNECDSAVANVRWNNADRMEQRIEKVFDAINKLNESNVISIDSEYLQLKLDELRLTHEYREKKQIEKEEQAEIRRQMREEAKLEQEVEQTIKEEAKYHQLLEKAKQEAEITTGDKLEKLQEKINKLQKELELAQEKSERAKSMAEQTKSGHIYIISNIGSFGENVYKIGMTRRLDPIDRVKELGDASVPFIFDIHAMIYSKNAPELEKKLHKQFDTKRLNLVNNRKEFFNVSLEAIKKEVSNLYPDAEFVETTEARQFRESAVIRTQFEGKKRDADARNSLPDEI